MRNFSGCCRFAYNALLAQEKEEYQEYLEELESRLCCGEALSKAEAKAQIKEKRYGIRLSDKEVITLAIIIVNENKDEMHEAMREVAAIEEIL